MKKAIIISYVTCQNEPSIPENVLLDIPEDEEGRDAALRAEWNNHFDPDEEDLVITDETAYGDLEIGNGDCFLFFTYINLK